MSMTVIVTRNASGRVRGFLASCMCEVAPGVYTAPRMTEAVRIRVWGVLVEWVPAEPDCSTVMTWSDRSQACGQSVLVLGSPACDLRVVDGVVLARRAFPAQESEYAP